MDKCTHLQSITQYLLVGILLLFSMLKAKGTTLHRTAPLSLFILCRVFNTK